MQDEPRCYEVFNLNRELTSVPPDPESAALHRAEILVKSDTLRVVLVSALAGATLNEHSAPGPITIQVIEGAFTLTVDGDIRPMAEGELAVVAPAIRHEVRCDADGAFLLTIAHLSYTPDPGNG